jgi:hypothetical protein
MALTAEAFNVNSTNATPDDIAKLNLALSYLAKSETGAALMQQAADQGVTISINHVGDDSYDAGVISWDPKSPTVVISNPSGGSTFVPGESLAVGVQSAALGLVHEAAHATDPDLAIHLETPNFNYQNAAEELATLKENIVAADLGEPARYNHGGIPFVGTGPDPTEHTTVAPTGDMIWVTVDEAGNTTPQGTYELGTFPLVPPMGGGSGSGPVIVIGPDVTVPIDGYLTISTPTTSAIPYISIDPLTASASPGIYVSAGSMISTLPGGDFKISNFDISGVLQSEQEVFVAGNSLLKYYDTHNTHPWTELDVSEDATGNPTGVQVVLTPAAAAAGSVGQVLGSAIGHALAPNNPFVQLAAGTVVGAIGQQLSQAIAQGGLSFDGSGMSIAGVFQGFNVTLENAASGSVASFLTAEIGTALGLQGWGGQLFDAAVGGYTGSILSQAVQIGLGNVVGDIHWDVALNSSAINIAGAVGSILAHQLVTAHTQAGAIGGQLVGAIGSIVGLSVGQALGLSLDFILPGVGSLIGTILGTWLGDLFAPDPAHPYSESTIDPSTYSYSGHVFYVGGNGSSAVSNAMADTAASVVNAYLTAVGGVALASSKQLHIGYQTANAGALAAVGRFRFERRDRRKSSRIPFRTRSGRRTLRGFPVSPKRMISTQVKCA